MLTPVLLLMRKMRPEKTIFGVISAMILASSIIIPVNLAASDSIKVYTLQEIEQRGHLILINQNNRLPTGYSPKDLETVNRVPTKLSNTLLQAETLSALEEMFEAAKNDSIDLLLYSGYRTEATQRTFYLRAGAGSKSVAPPRASEHETGYAADIVSINDKVLNTDFGKTPAGKWLAANCYKYGFILRYPNDKTRITRYMYEPWHYRYLGKAIAGKVHKSGLCYEEYIEENGRLDASSN